MAATYDHYSSAGVEQICRRIRSYGILTEGTLTEMLHPSMWHGDSMRAALREGERAGRIRHLGGGLYDLTEAERGR
jgi:hypothetical protein